jgi:uncharacterized membrane protein
VKPQIERRHRDFKTGTTVSPRPTGIHARCRAWHPGVWPVCNRDPATAPCWHDRCAPLCWRCLALSAGVLIGAALPTPASPWLMSLLLLPCFFDGLAHYRCGWRSSNRLRIVTGLPGGIGLILFAQSLFPYLS